MAADDRADDRQHERAADLERGLHEPGRQALLVVGDARGPGMLSAGKLSAKPRPSSSIVGRTPAEVDRESCRSGGTARSRRRRRASRDHDQARRADAVDQRADARRPKATSRPAGRNASAVSERRPAEQRLQVERDDELEADVAAEHASIMAEVRPHQRARAQDPEPHERVATRRSMATKAASSTAASAKPPSVWPAPQPRRARATMVRTSSSIAAVSVTAPGTSKRAAHERRGRVLCGSRADRCEQGERDRGTGSRKVQRQPSVGQEAAEDEAEREAARADGGVDAERPVALRGPRRRSW